MRPLRVLYFAHGHPSVRPGGAEAYAHELYQAMRDQPYVEAALVCRVGDGVHLPRSGTLFSLVGQDTGQYFLHTSGYHFDWVYGTVTDKEFLTRHVDGFVRAFDPDIVHFQHTQFMGYDIVRAVHNAAPNAGIVYTLHEYLPICHRDGQMVRTVDEKPCMEASPQRCHECFPHIAPQTFFLRKRFIQSQIAFVDKFIAPSKFLGDRYVDWGLDPAKVWVEEYGRLPVTRHDSVSSRRFPDRFAFLGQLSRYKGVDLLVRAMELVEDAGSDTAASAGTRRAAKPKPHLYLHGANLDIQREDFQRNLKALLDKATNVTLVGRYAPQDLPQIMSEIDWVVVPSIWWENSPLVIQEAFMYGRPVITSDIGGMAEKVTDGVNGLHFRAGSARSLAEAITRAAGDRLLWEKLAAAPSPDYSMLHHAARVRAMYARLGAGSRVPA
jgi:glycosyltransferase involved in cell wall biosynthesis